MDNMTLAYLAGAVDSDGCLSIKRSTYHMRVRSDASNPVFSERATLCQVTKQIPELLHSCFGGRLAIKKPSCKENGKPLWIWETTDLNAAKACKAIFPYLRVKHRQAGLLLELRESKQPGYGQIAHWFAIEFPKWETMELITTQEAARLLGHRCALSVTQAIRNGSLLALPYDQGGQYKPRIPKLLVERTLELAGSDGRARRLPRQLVEWRERLWYEVHELNKIGIHGTSVYHQTGHHKPASA